MFNLIDKYKPKNSLDFIGHFKFVNDIKSRLNKPIFKKIIICIGYSGTGKTTLLKEIFKELNYDYKEFFDNDMIKKQIDDYICLKSITSFFKKEKKLIFIDDLEVLSNNKTIINYLSKIDTHNIPVICVINKIYSRKFNDLRKKAEVFYISKPPMDKCYKYIIQIYSNENYELNNDKLNTIKKIIKNTNFNIKYILLNLDNLLTNFENIIDYNDVDSDLYDIINNIIKNKYPIEELEKIIVNDISLLSMLLHENMFTIFNKNKMKEISNGNIIDIYENTLEDLCISDKLENKIFETTNWKLYNIMSIIKIYKLNHYYSKLKHTEFNKMNFTQVLTKYSLRYNYNKKKFMILDDYNLSSNYFDYIIQHLLQTFTNTKINGETPQNLKHTILEILENKEYSDILKKYNKEYNIINNNINNKFNIK